MLKYSKKKNTIILIIFVSLAFLCIFFFYFKNQPTFKISKKSPAIFFDRDLMKTYIQAYGLSQTIVYLHQLEKQYGSCHEAAHIAGRISYELYKGNSFQMCSPDCQAGCYHGAVELFFKENGTANIQKSIASICYPLPSIFYKRQCIHGIGHGILAWSNYELHEALNICDKLKNSNEQFSCYNGVFMENIIGALSFDEVKNITLSRNVHFTKYLSTDPQYPCNIVEDRYKSACYFYQTTRMIALLNSDFSKISKECQKAPKKYQQLCFASMGRDTGGENIKKSISACSYAPEGILRTKCLAGAAQNLFWDKSGQDKALLFCKALNSFNDKKECYTIIFGRGTQVLNLNEFKKFCQKAELKFQGSCFKFEKLAITQ